MRLVGRRLIAWAVPGVAGIRAGRGSVDLAGGEDGGVRAGFAATPATPAIPAIPAIPATLATLAASAAFAAPATLAASTASATPATSGDAWHVTWASRPAWPAMNGDFGHI